MKNKFNLFASRALSMILAIFMVLGIIPVVSFATTEGDTVYIAVTDCTDFITNGYVSVPLDELTSINLETYGLSDFLYDKNGDGTYETTLLHLYIYVHTQLLGRDWSDVTVTGSAGSIYFAGGLFGFEDENLRYNYNGAYPADENGWGFTADRIVLSDGDFIEVFHSDDWSFYMDSAYGFHYFTNENDKINISYTVEAGSDLSVKLIRVGGGMGGGDATTPEVGYTVYYGSSIGNADGSVITDDSGIASITFTNAGTYYIWCDAGYGTDMASGVVSNPASAVVTVTAGATPEPAPETPREPQNVSTILNATMAKLASTVTEPVFGTTAGEWTVLSLARGGYFAKDNAYFTDYYNRIVETVNTEAAKINMSGALHKNKSTENSRLIVALSAIGKDATSVGDWDLVEAYSSNGFDWIKKQGLNGTIWALIALDSNNYTTSDTTIRQQCVDAILAAQHDDGGWSLMANKTYASDPDVTGMALQALYPYKDQTNVAAAAAKAIVCLSEMQHDNGTFASGGSECSESCAWVIVATTAWGINPDTDSRFIKNGNSVVDGLLRHYLEDDAQFQHVVGAGANAMATDQSCYALVAYDRFINGKTALYDYSDVTFDAVTTPDDGNGNEGDNNDNIGDNTEDDNTTGDETDGNKTPVIAYFNPTQSYNAGDKFSVPVYLTGWDNNAGYKLFDMIIVVPSCFDVLDVKASSDLTGGDLNWNLEADTGKLRIAYFDANNNNNISVAENTMPELFTINFRVNSAASAGNYNMYISGMSLKRSSDSSEADSQEVVKTENAGGTVTVVNGISFTAQCLYTGDDVDIIPSTKKAVAVSVTAIDAGDKLVYKDETHEIEFNFSAQITEKTGKPSYIALVDSSIDMQNFVDSENYTIDENQQAATLNFGDANGDGIVNAQDALASVNVWLRKTTNVSDNDILALNVNGDSRINTFDALGIVEAFVNNTEFGVVTKATLKSE